MKTRMSLLILCLMTLSQAAIGQDKLFDISTWTQQLRSQLDSSPSKAAQILSPAGFKSLEAGILKTRNSQLAQMKKARLLYSQGKFEQALALYDQIQPGSDQWLQALEEKGWAFHRQKNFQKALSQTKTLLSQAFTPIVGSEPFFLQSLSQLKICDYKGILETHELFKKSQKKRLVEIQSLAQTGDSVALSQLPAKASRFPIPFKDIGEEAKVLPRLFHRDLAVQSALLEIRLSQVGMEEIGKRSNIPNSQTLMEKLSKIHSRAQAHLKSRMKQLAEIENEENFKMIQKLNLIEIETIQRIHADQELDRSLFKKGQFAQASKDDLVFPDDGHPWIDEVDKFQVKVNSCPQNIRRKM